MITLNISVSGAFVARLDIAPPLLDESALSDDVVSLGESRSESSLRRYFDGKMTL